MPVTNEMSRTYPNACDKASKRTGKIDTNKAIELLLTNGSIYWTDEVYCGDDGVDWLMVAIFLNTQNINTFGQGMVTRVYL